MSIVAVKDKFNALSGKYDFHGIKNNKPVFIHEDGDLGQLGVFSSNTHYLVHNTYHETSNEWNIQSDQFFMEGKAGGLFRNTTSGK